MALKALSSGDAVIVINVQNDFFAGGVLPVQGAEQIIETANDWLEQAAEAGAMTVATRDWHPPDHISFAGRGGSLPPHCVQGSDGAEFHPSLKLPDETLVVDKGTDPDREAYSDFAATDLARRLREAGVRRVWLMGLTLEGSILAAAMDGRAEGFDVHVVLPATRPANVHPGDYQQALDQMRNARVVIEPQKWPWRPLRHTFGRG